MSRTLRKIGKVKGIISYNSRNKKTLILLWGLIKPIPKTRDENVFSRNVFCTHCNNIARKYGNIFRFFSSNETSFLTLLTASQNTEKTGFTRHGCDFTKKGSGLSPILDFSGAAAVQLGRARLLDRYYETGRRSLGFALKLMDRQDKESRKVLEGQGFPSGIFELQTRKQHLLESGPSVTLDEVVKPSESIVGELFMHTSRVSDRGGNSEVLYEIGRDVGSLVYVLDSVRDFRDDILRGTFNAFTGCSLVSPVLRRENVDKMRRISWGFLRERLDSIRANSRKLDLNRYQTLVVRTLSDDLEVLATSSLSYLDHLRRSPRPTPQRFRGFTKVLSVLPFIAQEEPDLFCQECDECAQSSACCTFDPEALCVDYGVDPVTNSLRGVTTVTVSTITTIMIYSVLKRMRSPPVEKDEELGWPEEESELLRDLETEEDEYQPPVDRPAEIDINELMLDLPEEPVEGVQIASEDESYIQIALDFFKDAITRDRGVDAKRPPSWELEEPTTCSDDMREQFRIGKRPLDYDELQKAGKRAIENTPLGTASKLDDALKDPVRFQETGEGTPEDKLGKALVEFKMELYYDWIKKAKAIAQTRGLPSAVSEVYDYNYPDPLQWMELTGVYKHDDAAHRAIREFVDNFNKFPDLNDPNEREILVNYYKNQVE